MGHWEDSDIQHLTIWGKKCHTVHSVSWIPTSSPILKLCTLNGLILMIPLNDWLINASYIFEGLGLRAMEDIGIQ